MDIRLWKIGKKGLIANGRANSGGLWVTFKLVENKSTGEPYVSFPAQSYESDGETKWSKHCGIDGDKDFFYQFQGEVLDKAHSEGILVESSGPGDTAA